MFPLFKKKSPQNKIQEHKTLPAIFYRQHKILWYQFRNSKHLLKAGNSEISLASSREEFCIGFHVTQYSDYIKGSQLDAFYP